MTKNAQKRTLGSRFLSDRFGNFSMMTAIIFPIMLAAGGVAMDLTNMVMTKAALQDATDSAALAAASALANDGMTATEARLVALRFLKTQVHGGNTVDSSSKDENDIESETLIDITEKALVGTGKSFKVEVSMNHTLEFNAFTRLLGQTSATLTSKSTAESATESKNALSMFLVLDKSGSMAWITNEKDTSVSSCINWTEKNWGKKVSPSSPCYIPKMAALKLAVASLFTQLTVADPTKTYVRTAAVSYDLYSYTPTTLDWGVSTALTYVNNLVADGGTASTGAMKTAYEKLKEASENTAHKNKNGQVPTKYIVFMTDGDNNNKSDDTKTKTICDNARNDKIEVYTVAFMAPDRGQELLKYCATSASHYFEAEDMAALVKAFKAIGERTSAVVSRLTK
ncbi:pilus assembly protein [Shinella pollutisoli]|uniref:VWA domain-containing protein n=2 Tax=Shinella pollutisoli TaxID=2250594 RepID=A0ABV7DJN1_9HYPH|nr:pilus assembly protein [Shinella pollutisoli]